MKLKLNNQLHLSEMKPEMLEAVKKKLTVKNPAFIEAEKMDRHTGHIEEHLEFYQEVEGFLDSSTLICPRGFLVAATRIGLKHGEFIEFYDERMKLDDVDFEFHGELRLLQKQATKNCLDKDFGVLEASTGAGKTVMGLYIIAQRKQPTLILVHTKILLYQWIKSIEKFLKIPKKEIGIIGDGKFKLGDKITVGMIQTASKRVYDIKDKIGNLVVDECHRIISNRYRETVEQFNSQYMTGLSATPWRRDKLTRFIFYYLGDKTAVISKQDLLNENSLSPARVEWVRTNFKPDIEVRDEYSKAVSEMIADFERNTLICDTISNNQDGSLNLIITDRKNHCFILKEILKDKYGVESEILIGDTGKKERERIFNSLETGKCHNLFATGSLIGEGFDLPAITRLYFVTPLKFSGRLIQYFGRALRVAEGKESATIFDFVDVKNMTFRNSAISRLQTYRKENILTN